MDAALPPDSTPNADAEIPTCLITCDGVAFWLRHHPI
jgi:hypothetical protein